MCNVLKKIYNFFSKELNYINIDIMNSLSFFPKEEKHKIEQKNYNYVVFIPLN